MPDQTFARYGLTPADPLNLNSIGYGADPNSVAASLQDTHAVEHTSRLTPVLWADLGMTRGPLPGAVRMSLRSVWTAVLAEAGA